MMPEREQTTDIESSVFKLLRNNGFDKAATVMHPEKLVLGDSRDGYTPTTFCISLQRPRHRSPKVLSVPEEMIGKALN